MSIINSLPFNWFDLLLLGVLIFGLQQGRKHGMSDELIRTLKWVAIAFGCAFAYEPIGRGISGASVFSLLSSYLMAYVAVAMIIALLFSGLKRAAGGKLIGSDVFGRSEFYLGMIAGMVRLVCILVAALALLNARAYTTAEIRADKTYQNDVYGSTFFPKLYTIQAQVFETSLSGPFIKEKLSPLLIKPTPPENKTIKQKEFAAP